MKKEEKEENSLCKLLDISISDDEEEKIDIKINLKTQLMENIKDREIRVQHYFFENK